MTIEEKAKEYSGYNKLNSQDLPTSFAVMGQYYGFEAGARWMINKALEWFKHQKEEIGISWLEDFEIRFRKAMEE